MVKQLFGKTPYLAIFILLTPFLSCRPHAQKTDKEEVNVAAPTQKEINLENKKREKQNADALKDSVKVKKATDQSYEE